MMERKIAVLVYPFFSLQEISCLTDALTIGFGRELDIYASSREAVRSEDGFAVLPDHTLEEFKAAEYACVVLPGILNPLPALFDEKLIDFLRGLKGEDLLLAAISSAPMLLAKAGLLSGVRYTAGIWEEISEHLDFIPHTNIVRKPVVRDGNIVTAIGFAFREFAEEVIRALDIDACAGGLFAPAKAAYSEEELTFHMGAADFAEFRTEYEAFLRGERQGDGV